MADKMLRHIPTGVLYIWQPSFAQRADFEDVVPEPEPIVEPVADAGTKASKSSRKKADKVAVPSVKYTPEPVFVDEEALSADASRGLP